MPTFWDSSIRFDLLLSETIGEMKMPPLIEIKGLGLAVASAKKGIAELRSETAGLSTDASALVSAIQDVRSQIKQAHEDLKFEAETLGNGGEQQSEQQQKPKTEPVITAPVGFDLKPGAVNRVEPGAQGVVPVTRFP